jgi:drug/metabolite transporter (DMT)-like permease
MTTSQTRDRSAGTFTVFDIMLFVAACSVSILLIRTLRSPGASLDEYLTLTAYCGPAGVGLFGPWAVRRQFVDRDRDELWPAEWLWLVMGSSWLAAIPIAMRGGRDGIQFVSHLFALMFLVPAVVAIVQSLSWRERRPWTHWIGILLCLLQSGPALAMVGPAIWHVLERIVM